MLFLSAEIFQPSSDEESPLVTIATGVGKSNSNDADYDNDNCPDNDGDDKDGKSEDDNDSPGKKVMMILVMQVFHSLKDFMWSKITIPNAIMLVLNLWG